jgi:hypothetical protein
VLKSGTDCMRSKTKQKNYCREEIEEKKAQDEDKSNY